MVQPSSRPRLGAARTEPAGAPSSAPAPPAPLPVFDPRRRGCEAGRDGGQEARPAGPCSSLMFDASSSLIHQGALQDGGRFNRGARQSQEGRNKLRCSLPAARVARQGLPAHLEAPPQPTCARSGRTYLCPPPPPEN